MAKHSFRSGLRDEHQKVVGAKCDRCGEIAFYEDGRLTLRKMAEECPSEDYGAAPMPNDSKEEK